MYLSNLEQLLGMLENIPSTKENIPLIKKVFEKIQEIIVLIAEYSENKTQEYTEITNTERKTNEIISIFGPYILGYLLTSD